MDRGDIKDIYKWDLSCVYGNSDDFDKDYNMVLEDIESLKQYDGIMMDSANNFYETIKLSYKIERYLDKLYSYCSLSFDMDTRDNDKQSVLGKVTNLYDSYNKVSYYMVPSMLKKDYSLIEGYYEEVPELKEYEISIKRIFRYKDHTLSDREEKLLSSLGKAFGNDYDTYELLKDSDLTFGMIKDEDGLEVELTCSNYSLYIESKDRRVRKDAFTTLYKTYEQFKNTFASTISGHVKQKVVLADIKKYKSAMEMCLYGDELDSTIYNNLIDSVNKGLNKLHKYYEVMKKVLELDELHLYDTYVPLIKESDFTYPFEEACETVYKALSVLGEDYVNILKQGVKDRWIDVYPNKGKRTGGYSGGSYDSNPYILLNYQDRYSDMSTLAHEAGHSMHSYYARHNNPYQYGDYAIFVAEVASTVNELLLARYILDNSSSSVEKINILDRLMQLYKATIYRQTMFAEFERDIYDLVSKDETLTANKLSEKYYELNKKYFGDSVVVDEEIKYEWERIPHFYYDFYVYKYATGLAAATKIVDGILSGKEDAVKNYLEFLKCGRTKNPLDSLKVAGVDLSKKETIDKAIEYFEEIVLEFEKVYNELYK